MISAPQEFAPFESVSQLKAAYSALLDKEPADPTASNASFTPSDEVAADSLQSGLVTEVQGFLHRAAGMGRITYSPEQRRVIQTMMTYWSTFLIRQRMEPVDSRLDKFDPAAARARFGRANPYKSLNTFEEADSMFFFGRQAEIGEAEGLLRENNMLMVVGPSGCGKSSFVRAGLVPTLRQTLCTPGQPWSVLPPVVPGSSPVEALAEAAGLPVEEVRNHPDRFGANLRERAGGRVVLVVDQFEEMYMQSISLLERATFNECLLSAGRDSDGHIVLMTMRSDATDYLKESPRFVERIKILRLSALSAANLRDIIEAPAAMLGAEVEPAVVDRLVGYFLGESSALPLLQYVLAALWEKSDQKSIRESDLNAYGPPLKALADQAEKFRAELSAELGSDDTLRLVMLSLQQPGLGDIVHRRRRTREQLWSDSGAADDVSREEVDGIVEGLQSCGLLKVAPGKTADLDLVEVTHESVLRSWPTLTEWIKARREDERDHAFITEACQRWQNANGDRSLLLSGPDIDKAEHLRAEGALSEEEAKFLDESRSAAKILTLTRQSVGFVSILGVVALFVLAGLIFARNNAIIQKSQALEERTQALTTQGNELKDTLSHSDTLTKTLRDTSSQLANDNGIYINVIRDLIQISDPAKARKILSDSGNDQVKRLATTIGVQQPSIAQYVAPAFATEYGVGSGDSKPSGVSPKWIIWHSAFTTKDVGVNELRAAQKALGWSDIGYHFVIRKDGRVETGKAVGVPGANVGSKEITKAGISICFAGDATKEPLTPEQMRVGIEKTKELLERYPEIKVEHVIAHSEVALQPEGSKARYRNCPGSKVDMESVRQRLRDGLAADQ